MSCIQVLFQHGFGVERRVEPVVQGSRSVVTNGVIAPPNCQAGNPVIFQVASPMLLAKGIIHLSALVHHKMAEWEHVVGEQSSKHLVC